MSLVVGRLSWTLTFLATGNYDASSLRFLPGTPWQEQVDSGILDGAYLDRIDCIGDRDWNEFRGHFIQQVQTGRWDMLDESTWIQDPGSWELAKKAEDLIEAWRSKDLGLGDAEKEYGLRSRSEVTDKPFAVIDFDLSASMIVNHLTQLASKEGAVSSDFGSSCLPGLILAIIVFGRALNILGQNYPRQFKSAAEDGYVTWRQEHGYYLEQLLFGEGVSIPDLFEHPGWPGFNSYVLEGALHATRTDPDDLKGVQLGAPQRHDEPKVDRLPPKERYHRATDPMSVTEWAMTVAKWMASRADIMLRVHSESMLPDWDVVGPAWVQKYHPDMEAQHFPHRPARLVALIGQHGALDLEIPELLLSLFPDRFQARFLLHMNHDAICAKTEGSQTLERICREKNWHGLTPPNAEVKRKRRMKVIEARIERMLHEEDPRWYFEEAAAHGQVRHPPDLVTLSGFVEALYFRQEFPDVPLILYFGPPLLLDVGTDIFSEGLLNGRYGAGEAASEYFTGVYDLLEATKRGVCNHSRVRP